MKPYADTNFFTRLYLPATGNKYAASALSDAVKARAPTLPITWLHRMEFANSVQLSVWLGLQGGHPRITPETAAVANASFRDDLLNEDFMSPAGIEVSDLLPLFDQMAARHTAGHGFRTYDIMHVASARLLDCDHFLTFDAKAKKLAALEGLAVLPR